MGTLFIVATPIGNLEDISQRALTTLQQVQLIAAEDTRRTRKLLGHYNIHTPTISYHEHNKITRLDEVLAALSQGDVALVSDAGTPALNDPGYELVCAALDRSFPVSPIPGPSAPLAALVASGMPTDAFLYLGYMPRKSGDRQQLLSRYEGFEHTILFLEAPHRLIQSLQTILAIWGDRQIAVARELTKLHEEIFRGRVSEAIAHFGDDAVRGEITLVVAGNRALIHYSKEEVRQALLESLDRGGSPAEIAARVSTFSGWPRRQLYQIILEIQRHDQNDGDDSDHEGTYHNQ